MALLTQEIELQPNQSKVFYDKSRFIVLVAGRRWAKTTTLLIKMLVASFNSPGLYGFFAPTYKQAKLVAWDILKSISPRHYILKTNETELMIVYRNGAKIRLFGLDKAENLLGVKLAGAVIDEYDQTKTDVYETVIRPALSDSVGFCWFAGSPDRHKRKLRELYDSARINKYPDWNTYHFRSIDGGYIPAEEIENAKRELDERTYREQYEASFEDVAGQVYYSFSATDSVRNDLAYNPNLPLRLFWDFNVSPFCVGMAHSIPRENNYRQKFEDVHVFDELAICGSNTPEMCKILVERFKAHKTGVHIYGDATAKARNTASSLSDYQIILEHFKNFPGIQIKFKDSNPAVKDRCNSVNSKLRAFDGTRHLFVHPRCKSLIRDFMHVAYKEGTSELDKTDPELTHISDGLGYFVDYEYPVIKTFIRS